MKIRSRTREPKSEKTPAQQRGGFHLASARAILPGKAETQFNTSPSFAQHPAEPRHDVDSTPLWMNINFSELPLDSDSLPDSALLELAIAGTRTALPQRAKLETCFGVSLANIAVYCNPATRKALERFNAEAAVYRGQILLRDTASPLFTLAHEIAHILQFDATEASPSEAISPATATAESEAESLASRVERRANSRVNGIPFAPLTAEAKLGGDVVALRSADRTRPATMNESTIAAPAAESGPGADRPAPAPERQTGRTPKSERRPQATGETAPTPGVDAEATGFGELPTAPEPGVTAEQVAARAEQVAAAQTALDNAEASPALMDAFATAPPTIKAQVSGDLGNRFTAAMRSETQTIQENTPAVEAEMNGNTPVAAGTITSPDATTVELEPVPPEPTPDAETVVGASVQNEEDAERNTSLVGRIAAAGGNPLALERLRAQLEEQSLDNVQTSDPSIVTSPGEPPAVPLQGETDPQRYQNQLDEGSRQGREVLALQREQALALPGVERVQLADVHESLPLGEVAAPVADDAASPEGAQQYLQLNMPAEVQTAFDDIAGPSMQQSQAEAQTQVQQAARDRDQQHQAEVEKAETETANAQRQADTAQRNHAAEARSQIETSRRETLDGQQAAVENMEADAELKRETERQEFDRQAEEKQGEIDGKYTDAEAEAEAKVREGEAEAEAERQRKEREAEDQSWWEAALDFITDLFDALVSFINKVFDAVRSAINGLLNVLRDAVMGLINAIASALKGLIRAFGEILKGLVQTLLGDLFPELAAKLSAAIDSAVEMATSAIDAVADVLKSAVNFIVETLRAGINALLNVFQGALNAALALARAALTGDWEAFFLQLFEAACRVAGIDPESIYAFIGRARETIDIIVNDPGQFVSNIFDSVLGGFRLFGENFLTHLQRSVIEWLTGTLGSAGITLPERFDLMGVIGLVAQILGLTWANLRQRIVRVVGERGVQIIEFVAGYVQTLIEGGWSALWERIQNDLASLRDMVLDQLKNFIVERIITAALTRLATMFNPVGALVNLILAAYQFYTFVRDQMERIARVVGVVAEMIGNIARGVLGPAMQAVESVLANLLTLALDLLARLLGLGNVGARVREILESVQATIWGAIDRLIESVLASFRGGGGAGSAEAAGMPGEPLLFQAGGESHRLYIDMRGRDATVMVASAPRTVDQLHALWTSQLQRLPDAPPERKRQTAEGLLGQLRQGEDATERQAETGGSGSLLNSQRNLVNVLRRLFELFEGHGDAAQTAGSREILERWEANLRRADPAASQQLFGDLAAQWTHINSIPAGNWERVETELERRDTFFQKPLLAGSFATAVHGRLEPEILPAFEVALQQYRDRDRLRREARRQGVQIEPVTTQVTVPEDIGDFITRSVRLIHAERPPFRHSLTQLRRQVSDRGQTRTAQTTLRQEYSDSIPLYYGSGGPEHQLFRPVPLPVAMSDSGYPVVRYRYQQVNGPTFEVSVNDPGSGRTIRGRNLQLRWVRPEIPARSRGMTEATYEENIEFNAAHLIADQFMGSGYRDALNTATTSAHYNQRVMLDQEIEIATYIRGFRNPLAGVSLRNVTFDLTVEAAWGPPVLGDGILQQIREQVLSRLAVGSTERQQFIADFAANHRRIVAMGTQIKRLLGVTYTIEEVRVNDAPAPGARRIFTIGPDIYLGMDTATLDRLFPQS